STASCTPRSSSPTRPSRTWTWTAPAPRHADGTVTPKGGVRAGADGLREAGDPAFLAAGGAMAAAGAAGLGFAMLRRGRTDG
ncbi:hypothetical protein AB0I84_38575, partial [Streptomyces spectabilis]